MLSCPGQLRRLLCFLCVAAWCNEFAVADVEWTGTGAFRLLVKVESDRQLTKPGDERPAELQIDFRKQLKSIGIDGRVDVGSIQVIPYDASTGSPQRGAAYAYGTHECESPFRWYDAAIPYDFPEFADAVSRTKEEIRPRPRVRSGYFYNVVGDWERGRLIWMHQQKKGRSNSYAVYFDPLPDDELPKQLPPRAWVGDGTPRCDRVGGTTTGADHSRIDIDDWNGDGLLDLIIGEQSGHLFWWPNLGTKSKPEFRYGKFVFADGAPLDSGLEAAPKVVDWDGDGVKDVLVGAHWNRLLY